MNILKRIFKALFPDPQIEVHQDYADQSWIRSEHRQAARQATVKRRYQNPQIAVYRAERHGNGNYEPMRTRHLRKWQTGGRKHVPAAERIGYQA